METTANITVFLLILKHDHMSSNTEAFRNRINNLINQADALEDSRQYEQARIILQEALEIAPNDIEILRRYAKVTAKLGKLKEAFDIFEKALHISPNNVDILRNYGAELTDADDLDKAIVILNKAIEIAPKDVKVLSSYSKTLRKIGDVEQQLFILEYSMLIQADNNITQKSYIIVLNHYADDLVTKNRYEEAFELFERSLQMNPQDAITLNHYANALVEMSRHEEALEVFERSLQVNPQDAITLSRYANALVKISRHEEAFKLFERSLQIQPDNAITLNHYANALATKFRYQEAVELFERSLQVNPQDAITLSCCANVLVEMSRYEQAFKLFECSLEIEPKDVFTLNSYAKSVAKILKFEKSFDLFEQALKIQPNNPITLTSYAEELANCGDYEKALIMFNLSLKIKKDDNVALSKYIKYLKKYGLFLLEQGDYNKASKLLKQALNSEQDNFILFKYARSLEGLGNYNNAISQLETIDLKELPQYDANVIRLDLGRLYYRIYKNDRGEQYFKEAIANADDKELTLLNVARSIFAATPYSYAAVSRLKQIYWESPRYAEAQEMLTLNLSQEDYFTMVNTIDFENGLSDTEMLNRAMYHKIANEVVILKSIAYRILYLSQAEDPLLRDIIKSIENVSEQIDIRKAEQKSKIAEIPDDNYREILTIISKTAHDVSDFVNNELAVIISKTRRAIWKLQSDAPHYSQFNKLLTQLEFTQAALNDLKSINEGIKIKSHRFPVKKLFEKWEVNPKIDRATIYLNINNGEQEFKGDEEKIKSMLQEFVENSLKHNFDKYDLEIHITSKDVVNPSGIRGHNIPGEQKYLSIEFSDNGHGVPEDKKDWIFQPLKTTSPEGKGSGLGLFIIRKTLAKMNAYIRESGKNGVRFEIFIPYE